MKKSVILLECDICGKKSKLDSDTREWVEWSQDHPVISREWIERCACPSCINDIKNAIRKK